MRFRKDIEGLRAVAVLPVILSHAGYTTFAGGFVGVDVFFAISGFLITGILLDELAGGRFSIGRFYERRVRRLLPALFVMISVSALFAMPLMLPSQLELFAKGALAILVFCSNFFFWKNVDYFAAPAAENPLIHTWSLAVEEQFYLFFPLLLWLLARIGFRNRDFAIAIFLMSAASFAIAEWGWPRYPSPNFYLLPSRAWELGLGALAALAIRHPSHRPMPSLSLLGLVMIFLAVFLYDEDTPFPSHYAVLPVLGAALVMLFGQSSDSVGRRPLATQLLCLPPIVWVGMISYSAYLWHQPIFAFMRLAAESPPSPILMGFGALLSLGAGYLSWRFIEAPFRRPDHRWLPKRSHIFAASLTAGAVLAGIAAVGIVTNGFEQTWRARNIAYPDLLAALSYGSSEDNALQFLQGGCFAGNPQVDSCLKLSDTKKNYLIIGDSFAAHYANALKERYKQDNVMQLTVPGCRPVWNGRGTETCLAVYRALDVFLANNPARIDGIIISARWRNVDADDLKRKIEMLRGVGVRVAIIGPSPEYGAPLPAILLKQLRRGGNGDSNTVWDRDRISVEERFREVARETGAGFVPVLSGLCPGGACRNYADDGKVMTFDYGHFTLSGARTVILHLCPEKLEDLFLGQKLAGPLRNPT